MFVVGLEDSSQNRVFVSVVHSVGRPPELLKGARSLTRIVHTLVNGGSL